MVKSIEYNIAPLNAFRVLETNEHGSVTVMSIDGRSVKPTTRFWTSLCSGYSNYGLSTKLFKLFPHQEVFQRVTDVVGAEGKDRLRYTIENLGAGNPHLLAVTNPAKPLVEYPRMQEVLARFGATTPEYRSGIIRSNHSPQHMDDFEIAGDKFSHQYVMETPIDGYGKPLIYLSLLRQICANGMIGYARAFRTEINIGRSSDDPSDTMFSISRALDSFNNEEGYQALTQRFNAATTSWASVYEINRVNKILNKMATAGMLTEPSVERKGRINELADKRGVTLGIGLEQHDTEQNPVNIKLQRGFSQMVGNLCEIYGITHMDAISQKRMSKIPARCTVYDLLNFATEAATHYCTQKNGRLLQAEVGNLISAEYDLENTKQKGKYEHFTDFFTDPDTDTSITN